MMPVLTSLVLLALPGGNPPPATAQEPVAPLVRHTFSQEDGGWIGLGEIAKVSRTPAPDPTLRFEYLVGKDNLSALVRPFEPGALKGARRFELEVKSDTDTILAVMVQEKGGGRFSAVASLPKNLWQKIELAPEDLVLAKDKDDPADANGKLDVEQIEGVSLLDLHTFFIRMAEGPTKGFFPGITAGPRELWLKSFSASAAPLATALLDGLNRPQLSWVGIGGADLRRTDRSKSPLKLPSVEMSYTVGAAKLAGAFHALPLGVLAGKKELTLTVAAQKSATYLIQLEDDAGGKFNATLEVAGGSVGINKTLTLESFKPDNESKRDKLDPARVKQLLVLDISGLTESVEQNNTLWLANLQARDEAK